MSSAAHSRQEHDQDRFRSGRSASRLFVFSASNPADLAQMLQRALTALPDKASPHAFARELAERPAGPNRLAVIANDFDDLATKLQKAAGLLDRGRERINIAHAIVADRVPAATPRAAFLFPGFASQYPNMLGDLYARSPPVRRWIDGHSDKEQRSWRRNALLFSNDAATPGAKARLMQSSSLRRIARASLVANLSYFRLTAHFGLQCDAIVGHSFGENSALIAAQMMGDYDTVARLVREITNATPDQAPYETALLALSRRAYEAARDPDQAIEIALDNCPQQLIVCGESAVIERLEARVSAQKAVSFRLPRLTRPIHSVNFPVPAKRLAEIYAKYEFAAPQIPVWSCATAAPLPSEPDPLRRCLAEQWVSTVRFSETVERLYDHGIRTFVEVGPGGNLAGFVRDALRGRDLTMVSMDREGADTAGQLLSCLGMLWVRGHPIELDRLADGLDTTAAPVSQIASDRSEPTAKETDPDRGQWLERILTHVAELLELTDSDLLDPQSGFFDLGMGSLSAVELVHRLEQDLGRPLSPTVAFDYPSPDRLATHLSQDPTRPSELTARTVGAAHEPLAIVGIGCRFPGAADPEAFWELLQTGGVAISEPPDGRWPDLPAGAGPAVRHGAFLPDIAQFDAAYFGISPLEAQTLDPQQRLLLEVVWETLERAGLPPGDHRGSATGVYVGISSADYLERLTAEQRLAIGGYLATGNAASTAAGRISYLLGAQGPSFAVDTACSSSLVAVHLACQALRRGECDRAIAAGVGLLLTPTVSHFLDGAGALSPTGRCHTFSADADGYVRGEGCGAIVLERFSDARRLGHQVLAVVRGSAINHDGPTSGLTVPNGLAQEAVVKLALADASVDASMVSYVEAHGTGTPLGDPIELAALGRVHRDRADALAVGSVKTNIGHLEAAAGIAGLIKAVLQLKHRQLAPSLHFETPSPHVDWQDLPLTVCSALMPWQSEQSLVAGISSFGISGTNAHVVVQQAPPEETTGSRLSGRDASLLVVAARTESALAEAAGRLATHLQRHPDAELANIAYTTQVGRDADRFRAALVADSRQAAMEALRSVSEGAVQPRRGPIRLAFLLTGQGAQRPRMGAELYAKEPIYRQAIEQCDAVLRAHRAGSLLDVLSAAGSAESHPLDATAWAQPALFSVEYALTQLWRSWGVVPHAVLGHSVGELVGACVSGILTLDDALELVAARGELMQSAPPGRMLAIAASMERIEATLTREVMQALSVAAINGPTSVVLAGSEAVIDSARELVEGAGMHAIPLAVSHAFHSATMDPILEPFGQIASRIRHHRPQVSFVSNVTGERLATIEDPAAHWKQHLRHTVRFAEGVNALRADGCNVFLEIGPKPILTQLAREGAAATDLFLASLLEGRSEQRQMLESLGQLYAGGCDVDWVGFNRDRPGRLVPIPTYPFQRQPYWIEPPETGSLAARPGAGAAAVTLPGRPLLLPGQGVEHRFEADLSRQTLGILAEHRIGGHVSLPISALLGAGLRCGELLQPGSRWQLAGFMAHAALMIDDDDRLLLHTLLAPVGDGYQCRIFSRDGATDDAMWQLHAETTLRPLESEQPPKLRPEVGGEPSLQLDREAFYASCRQAGFDYGPGFQVLGKIELGPDMARGFGVAAAAAVDATPTAADARDAERVFEAALQTVSVLIGSQIDTAGLLLREVGCARLWRSTPSVRVEARLEGDGSAADEVRGQVALFDHESGEMVGELTDIVFVPALVEEADEPATAEMQDGRIRAELLEAITTDQAHEAVITYLSSVVRTVMRFPPQQALDPDQPLNEMGFDSIMAVWFRNRLQSELAVDLQPGEHLREPTLTHLTNAVLDLLRQTPKTDQVDWVEGAL